ARLPDPAYVDEHAAHAWHPSDFERLRAAVARGLDETGCPIDRARGPDRHEQLAGADRIVDALHLVRHLAEPDDVRANSAGDAAAGANRALAHRPKPAEARIARRAPTPGQLAMHVEQPLRAGPFVEVVDILRNQQQLARPF